MPKIRMPRYMKGRKLAGGMTAYYLVLPAHYMKREINGARCPLPLSTALGKDFAQACARHSNLIKQWDEWRAGVDPSPAEGSVDWLFNRFKKSRKYCELALRTQKDYDAQMSRIGDYITPKGQRRFGLVMVKVVRPSNADKMFEDMLTQHGDRQASYAMQVARLIWNWAKRQDLAEANPFLSMGLKMTAQKQTYAPSREAYEQFKAAARDLGLDHFATAATLAFELVQRSGDVIGRPARGGGIEGAMQWSDYKPGSHFEVKQNKTGVRLLIPMYDEDGVHLFPELEAELAQAKKMGPFIVMDPTHKSGIPMPMDEWKFRRLFRKIRDHAGLPTDFQFKGLRHGGATELGDAGVEDVRPMTGHTNIKMTETYNQMSVKKAAAAGRKRQILKNEIADALNELKNK